jgi:hypothetical protein
MAEGVNSQRLRGLREGLLFLWGCVFALIVLAVSGGLQDFQSQLALGWGFLWLLTVIGSVPLGIVMLIGPGWKAIPLADRRGTAMGYLLLGFVDVLALALLLAAQWVGHVIWIPVGLYGLGLFAAYAKAFADRRASSEETFP